ncbi:hypothetical protein ECE50_015200 [Chitinophaga sp. Mgbs1]|uniref:LiaF transmembrane domain-containing protein n=1 Tax=Chitinophaga solisilvae TaxID=1233460 RepID=A0A3S1JCY8_9BACT|nr:hypothetical protein [Chitinophaga solisilvae]
MRNEDIIESKKRSRATGGIILIVVGVVLLLKRLDLDLPDWLFSWQMILIAIGVLMGFKHDFKGGAWLIMISIGGIFLAGEVLNWPYNTARFIWPVVLIVVGIGVITHRQFDRHNIDKIKESYKEKYKEMYAEQYAGSAESHYQSERHSATGDDTINLTALFSGVDKTITSRNFQGGHVSAIFGGSDLNFMQADINGTVVLDVTTIFGGCEIIVPSNWTVKVDITPIMGGVEDKRPMSLLSSANKDKVLLVKGSCIFGGVEIKSYA